MSANIANVEASVSTHANLAWKPYTSNGGKLAEIIDITNTLRSAKHDQICPRGAARERQIPAHVCFRRKGTQISPRTAPSVRRRKPGGGARVGPQRPQGTSRESAPQKKGPKTFFRECPAWKIVLAHFAAKAKCFFNVFLGQAIFGPTEVHPKKCK